MPLNIVVESGTKRAFVSAIDWPGWARASKTEDAAIESLVAYRDRYAGVLDAAGISHRLGGQPTVIERLRGDATTDFGAPGIAAAAERDALGGAAARKRQAILAACWAA